MNSTEYLQAQLAERAWIDGGSEGLNGALAVAFTFRNRVRAGWWNGDWASVLEHYKEVDYRTHFEEPEMPNPGKNYAFFLLLQQIDKVFDGSQPDTITTSPDLPPPLSPQYVSPVALYYARLDRIESDKFLEEISRNSEHKRVASVGALTFFS